MAELPKYYPLMAYFPLLETIVSAFNAILFVLLSFYCIRDYRARKTRWGGYIFAYIVVLCAALFLGHLGNDFATEFLHRRLALFEFLEIGAKYLIPPLVFHLFYRNEKEHLQRPGVWPWPIALVYAIALAGCAAELNIGVFGWNGRYPGWAVARPLFRLIMTLAATGSTLILWTARPASPVASYSKRRQWLLFSSTVWMGTFLIGTFLPDSWNGVLEKVVPLCFIFATTFYAERFTFFDVLIKKGAFVFASLLLLTLYFVVVPPLLWRAGFTTWVGTLIWAVSVWPIVLFAPWGHRKLSSWVDRHFLGRRFSPAQATRHFLAGLQGAIDQNALVNEAEARLAEIFKSQVTVSLGSATPLPNDAESRMSVPIRLEKDIAGFITLQAREHARFLSEDVSLLTSLADSLAFLLENLRLREKRLEQEQREQELLLNTQRSELKALRAQINPHFLFNALNTIASLIQRHPDRAEETIEELAEVFRYTLRRSEREWVHLDEELEAVRAYLHIEQARFGESFRFRIDAIGRTNDVRIPAMIIQTLVENAVKHGVARLTTPGMIDVGVNASTPNLVIEVRDNGPGFAACANAELPATGGGYGLRNVQDRLRRYFAEAATLTIAREDHAGMTLVSIRMPQTVDTMGAAAR